MFTFTTEQRKDEDYDEVVEENLECEVRTNIILYARFTIVCFTLVMILKH